MAIIGLISSDAGLLSEVTRALSSAHEIHWLPFTDAVDRCGRRQMDALVVDLDSARADIDALRACVTRESVPVIIVGCGGRGDAVARSLGGVFFERAANDDGGSARVLPETVWSLVLLDAMRTARMREGRSDGEARRDGGRLRDTILVVDDDADIRNLLRDLLEHEGYAVSVADGGAEALAKIRSGERPSLILLDLMMPGVNGWEVRETLRSDPAYSSIPVAVISAVQPPAKAVGDWYLKKPIDIDELLRVIGGFLAAS